ncbi:MAG TPA: hypothetical protein DET40_01425 [Lentisphaeria bacterium]|nr:MAG: hypothetical protein A2X45_09325 [Lentisphaerae bacterium GWF2_50_93]HCE42193.1 hypothetical protein [Lentisphaeria bacterium]
MKVKCPYCNETSAWNDNKCPLCNKFALMPGFLKPKTHRKRSYHRERKSSITSPWMLNAGVFNVFGTLTKLPKWVLWIGFISVIGAYFQVSMLKYEQPEAISKAKYNISVLNTALDYFSRDCGRYPSAQEGLAALVSDPNVAGWKGPYIEKLKWDSWKRGFRYSSDGKTFRLFSLGADGLEGTADDIATSDRFKAAGEAETEISVSVEELRSLKKDMPKSGNAK